MRISGLPSCTRKAHCCLLPDRVRVRPDMMFNEFCMEKDQTSVELLSSVRQIIETAREKVYRSSNTILLEMYWQIGRLIVEDEQKGANRAQYGKATLKHLSQALTLEFGKGFDERNLNNMRAFTVHSQFGTQCVPN